MGGQEGEVTITGASDVSLITAPNGDIEAWLGDARYTRVTGLSDWSTITTEQVNLDGPAELPTPTQSDLWRTVDTSPNDQLVHLSHSIKRFGIATGDDFLNGFEPVDFVTGVDTFRAVANLEVHTAFQPGFFFQNRRKGSHMRSRTR